MLRVHPTAFMQAAVAGLLSLLMVSAVWATDEITNAEIEHLISSVGASGCTFVRNGKRYSASAAEDHLRLKYRKASKYADTAEHFVERLASKSSWTGKPYFIECPDSAPVPSADWLMNALQSYRDAS